VQYCKRPGECRNLGSASLFFFVWFLGGAYALLCSSSVTELGTMLPVAGGWYVYSSRAFGQRIGFVVGCCDWVVQSVATAYLAVAFGEFVAGFYPGLTAHAQKTGVAVLVFLAALNWVGLRMGSRAQELTSLVKAVGLLALVAACFIVSPKAPVTSPSLLSDSFALSWSVRSSNGFNQRPVGVILGILDSMVPA
jgi:basic amino acid/polyamine antiporter, APA family